MTRWRIDSTGLDERKDDYTASFTCRNMGTGESVDLTLRQNKGQPVSDLIGACSALAKLLLKAGDQDDDSNTAKLN